MHGGWEMELSDVSARCDSLRPSAESDFFAGGGELEALMRAYPWDATPLGAPHSWPQSLKAVVRILLTSRFAMWMGWGDDLTFFYNNAYRPTLGIKHEWALGTSAREVWREIWPDIGPRIEHVLKSGEATWDEALPLLLERRGYPEETYHTFSYSPLADDSGLIVGMLCVVTEDTERVIAERRLSCLNALTSDITRTNTRAEVLAAISRQLGANNKDLPFTLTYLFDEHGVANLGCVTGIDPTHPLAASSIDPEGPQSVWPVQALLQGWTMPAMEALAPRFGPLPTGGWDVPPREVVVAPITRQGHDTSAGFLVAAVNPYRRSDPTAPRFLNLITSQLASGFANADAYQEERRRAEALTELDRAKTAFFSNVSHEFRTPLTLMLGPLEEFLSRPVGDPGEGRSLIVTAHRNARRLLTLVNMLLDFSRIEAGRVTATYEPVDLGALTAELASSFRSAVEKAGLRLTLDCPRLTEPVYVDRDMWEKIVLNLLSNAFKFTFDGEIAVQIKIGAAADTAELIVRDTGTGIAATELPHLFERFHRVEGARGRTFEGSGIGLALVRELVTLQGGRNTVTSTPGRGSSFTVAIPFGTGHLPRDQIASAPAATNAGRVHGYVEEALRWLPKGTRDAPGLGELASSWDTNEPATPLPIPVHAIGRVLLAEDNADMRAYISRLLVERRYSVEAAADGEAALDAARRQPPDLILSDVMMPGLDGFGLVRAVRADPILAQVPIIVLSARAGEEARVEGLGRGADDYLVKPFSARELVARVTATLQMAAVRREAAESLRARTTVLETLLATVPAAVRFTEDADPRQIVGNRQAAEWLDLPGRDTNSLVPMPAGYPRFRLFRDGREDAPNTLPIRRAARGERVRDDEIELRFEDGRSMTVLAHATPLHDSSGQLTGAVCAAIDISSRKRLEEHCRQVVESAPSAMVMISQSGRIEMVNAQAERVFGYPRSELLGQPVEILLPDRLRRDHPGLRARFFAAPVSRPMGAGRDLFGRKKDGSEFPIEIGLSPISTDQGTMVPSAIVDLSERAAAARALAKSEAEFRASFESAAVGKVVVDLASRRIMRANVAFADMLGLQPEELAGRTIAEFAWHEDATADADDFVRLLLNEGSSVIREMRYLRLDGSPFWVRTSATVARASGNGGRKIVVRVIEDINTRYKAEIALKAAKLELELVVEQRTNALAQRDLLLREVYHRVKNNLQLVNSLLTMHGRKLEDPVARQALLGLRDRVSALGLVHQQLMGSPNLKTFDVAPFLDELSRNILDAGGIGPVAMSVAACRLDVNLDFAVPLGLLVTELVTNSLKHAFPNGTGTISVTLQKEADDVLALTVSDDGVGLRTSPSRPGRAWERESSRTL